MIIKNKKGEMNEEDFTHSDEVYSIISNESLYQILRELTMEGKKKIATKASNIIFEKEDLKLFIKKCKYWLRLFGVTDWNVDFSMHNNESDQRCFACWNTKGRVASIVMARTWNYNGFQNKKEVKNRLLLFALHEVLHLVFADVYDMIKDKYSRDVAEKEIHAVIWRLVNMISGGKLNDNLRTCKEEMEGNK